MSDATKKTEGGAMPAEGHEHRLELLNVENDIDEVRHLLEATWMAVDSLETGNQQAALHAILDVAQYKLTTARDRLSVARGAPVEDREDD
jgi:hypothetical protein